MQFEKKIALPRLLAGILLLLLSTYEFLESAEFVENGNSINLYETISNYTKQGQVGFIVTLISFIIALTFLMTIKIKFIPWLEIAIVITVFLLFILVSVTNSNLYTDLRWFKWCNLILTLLGIHYPNNIFN
ncbi:hypothetical protein LB941_09920 [Ligilactobacillus sp. WILCCON 0076]|uniref:Uncharacterized protein n=1 Tax=Ligilactobacillus ubinensis TaxID=2876789 RepID=A0A9X2FL19_9LACO|nr:hypothetical protein [Ligilactobacillus ubinensis]MCP0887647.1 hypothetical protein [Ligilactobacillus ubinensis]